MRSVPRCTSGCRELLRNIPWTLVPKAVCFCTAKIVQTIKFSRDTSKNKIRDPFIASSVEQMGKTTSDFVRPFQILTQLTSFVDEKEAIESTFYILKILFECSAQFREHKHPHQSLTSLYRACKTSFGFQPASKGKLCQEEFPNLKEKIYAKITTLLFKKLTFLAISTWASFKLFFCCRRKCCCVLRRNWYTLGLDPCFSNVFLYCVVNDCDAS